MLKLKEKIKKVLESNNVKQKALCSENKDLKN